MEDQALGQVSDRVQAFYERSPYPGIEDKLMLKNARRLSPHIEQGARVCFPGCGTGHGMVGLGVLRPDLKLHGLDLSEPSLKCADQLARKHSVQVDLRQGNYMQPLPWLDQFDAILLEGTLHHAADPKLALKNLVSHLHDKGLIYINLYGKKYHHRRFEIVEMLDLLQQGERDVDARFQLFREMMLKMSEKTLKSRLMDLSVRTVWSWLWNTYHQLRTRSSIEVSSVPWTTDFKEPNQQWADSYMNPNEKTFDICEAKELIESAGLDVVEMYSLGKVNMDDLPDTWRPITAKLDPWSQYRLMELYYPRTGSINLRAKKRS